MFPRVALAVGLALAACSDDKREDAPPASASDAAQPQVRAGGEPAPPDARPVPAVQYDESTEGLTELVTDLIDAVARDDEPDIARLLASLRLPEYESWFPMIFGDQRGAALASAYRPQYEEIGLLVDVLREQRRAGLSEVGVERFQSADAPKATGYQSAALDTMKSPVALYSVRLSTPSGARTFHLWSFVYEGGTFRYVGKMKAVTGKPTPEGRDLLEYRLVDAERIRKVGDP